MFGPVGITIGYILVIAGLISCLYWQLRFLVVAYNCSLWWFFGCLFVPVVDLLFLVFHFKVAKKPFILSWFGLIIFGLGIWMAGIKLRQ